jgi:hypothetical protein
VSDLQEALDRSMANASAFTRSFMGSDQWDATRVADFVNATRNITIATVTGAGEPHAVVVIAACLDGVIHFTVHPESLLRRNLERQATIGFSVTTARNQVMGKGTAVLVARSLDDPGLIDRLAATSAAGRFTPAGWDGSIYRIELDRIFAS